MTMQARCLRYELEKTLRSRANDEKKMSKRGHFIVVDPADRTWLAGLGFASVDTVLKYKPETIAAMSGSS